MHKSSSSGNPKGQWFLVSAVVISGVFLFISVLFKDYMVVDQSVVASMNEDFYFRNIKDGLEELAVTYAGSTCATFETKLDEFIVLSKEKMSEKNHLVARMWRKKTGKLHVHVIGCVECSPIKTY